MWCVIPAAGSGTRLAGLTRGQPKPLLEISSRPIIDRLLEGLTPAISDICIVVNEFAGAFRELLGESRYGMRIHYVDQPEPHGVADAVLSAREVVTGTFAVVMGDCYFDSVLAPYIDAWKHSGAEGAVLVEPATERVPGKIGIVHCEEDRIVQISKEPFEGQAEYRVCGMMVLPEEAFAACQEACREQASECELEDVVAYQIARGIEYVAIRYTGWRRNINTPEDLRLVEGVLRWNNPVA